MALTLHPETQRQLEAIPPFFHESVFTQRVFEAFAREITRFKLMQEAIINAYTPQRAGIDIEGWDAVWNAAPYYENLFTNPSFEATPPNSGWTMGTGTKWPVIERRSPGIISDNAWYVEQQDAAAAGGLTWIPLTRSANLDVPVTPGEPYSYAMEIDTVQAVTAAESYIQLAYFTAGGATNGTVTAAVNQRVKGNAGRTRIKLENQVPPAGSAFVSMDILIGNPGPGLYKAYFDGALAVRGTTVPAYFDGDFFGYEWAGTPHLSVSRTIRVAEPSYLSIWERMLGLSENPAAMSLAERRDRVVAFARKRAGQASGLAWEEGVSALIPAGWSYEEHVEGDAGTPAANWLRVFLPFGSTQSTAEDARKLLRSMTPAHLELEIVYGEGFIIGVDQLGIEQL